MFDPTEHTDALREAPTHVLEDVHAQLDALENAVRAHRMLVLALLDERDVGREDGAADTVTWLLRSGRTSRADARAQVETARALVGLPAIAGVACEGRLGREQLREAALGATRETDAAWADHAPGWTPSMLARARRHAPVTNEEALARQARRGLWWQWDRPAGMVRGRFALPDVEGATVVRALERLAEKAGPGPEGWATVDARHADALVTLASREVADDADPDRATVVVHVPAAALAAGSDEGGARLEDGEIELANDTARRLTCDARVQLLVEADDGLPLRLGRTQRTVPQHLRRVLRRRDPACRWPGCDRTRALHAHHLLHWEDGGATDPENLALLCPTHHRFAHEHRWSVRGDPNRPDGLEFRRSDGSAFGLSPPPLDERVRERFVAVA